MTRRTILPIGLMFVGVLMLVGCIPLPATQQFMVNGHLKPSWKIGRSASNPVQLGHTNIYDAMNFLSRHAAGEWGIALFVPGDRGQSAADVRESWRQVDDHHYAMMYYRRSGFIFAPLCGAFVAMEAEEYVVLKTDDADRVIGYEILTPEAFHKVYKAEGRPVPADH